MSRLLNNIHRLQVAHPKHTWVVTRSGEELARFATNREALAYLLGVQPHGYYVATMTLGYRMRRLPCALCDRLAQDARNSPADAF